jgi:hypothetical protein
MLESNIKETKFFTFILGILIGYFVTIFYLNYDCVTYLIVSIIYVCFSWWLIKDKDIVF